MQYIAGDTVAARQPSETEYAEGDVEAVAAAVKHLISLRVPADTAPGHVGGGVIGHDFFLECRSTSEYPTVKHLQAQINRVRFQVTFSPCIDPIALATTKLVRSQGLRVDYSEEIAQGLVLCPSDIDPTNFIIVEDKVFVIDFGRTGYMPPSFVSYSLEHWTHFTGMVARLVGYPETPHLRTMQIAAGLLVISGNNSWGIVPKRSLKRQALQ
ncbi:hypothetical protein B0H12DRAFT_364775 [Mycena haematopus]|nr:hypothetical protein B0H12DRAFT_364775 [Mycena haematopus]